MIYEAHITQKGLDEMRELFKKFEAELDQPTTFVRNNTSCFCEVCMRSYNCELNQE
jgi:hypothetical protein